MRPGRGLVVSGAILTVVSLVAGIVSIWVFVSGIVSGVQSLTDTPVLTTPVQAEQVQLDQGRYVVYVIESTGLDAVTLSNVGVVGPSGGLTVSPATNETFSNEQGSFRSIAVFTTPVAGSYALTVTGAPDTTVLVSKGVAGVFKVVGGAGVAAAVGSVSGLTLILGIVLLIVGLVRGRPPSGQLPPPRS